jgi:predicted nicotinamide N-methyase
MFSLTLFQKQYETDSTEVIVNEQRFRFLVPKSIDRFIDPVDPLLNFPLWSKIWPASIILSDYLVHLKVQPAKRFLEVGAGMGLVSIVATHWGHNFTLTEYDAHALNFARANALINKCPTLVIRKLDWYKPDLQDVFDYIVASEVLYKEESFQPLLKLFKKLLKPTGEVILVGEIRKHDRAFYKAMEPFFDLRIQRKVLRSANEETRIYLTNMRFK